MLLLWVHFWVQYSLLLQYETLEKVVTSILKPILHITKYQVVKNLSFSRYLDPLKIVTWRQSDMMMAWDETSVIHCISPLAIKYSKLSSSFVLKSSGWNELNKTT